jgi:hypothetical protein
LHAVNGATVCDFATQLMVVGLAEEVLDRWVSFQLALSNKRKYPTAEFTAFAARVRGYVRVIGRGAPTRFARIAPVCDESADAAIAFANGRVRFFRYFASMSSNARPLRSSIRIAHVSPKAYGP